ncbi:MAG: hypothetical protein FVQ80_06660 [Planctomycetes bacterium]|nr:hypothetical protein [Planctomycetota bacterium]
MKRKASKKEGISILKRTSVVTDYLSTGSTPLDLSVSCNKSNYGGIPSGRITEFSGGGATGKTYICGELCGDALRKGYDLVVVDDIERRWDLSRIDTFGLSLSDKRFVYLDPGSSTIEGCFETMFQKLDKLKSGEKCLYIVDPIAALYSRVEVEASDKMGQAKAKALQKNMRYLRDRVYSGSGTAVVFSNQLIDAVGKSFGPKKIVPGGNAMIHWPSVRVRFSVPKQGKITDTDSPAGKEITKVVGIRIHGRVEKNSEDDAFRESDFSIQYGHGIDDILDCALWLKTYTTGLDVDGKDSKWFGLYDHSPVYTLRKFIGFVERNDLEEDLLDLTCSLYRKVYKTKVRKGRYRRDEAESNGE